jgi:hypothetical protein
VDTFASHTGQQLTLVRSAAGQVTGLAIDDGGSSTSATRTEPYTEHEVTFHSDVTTLAGTLLIPTTAGPHPAVVISHGAERADRETYRLLATHYARHGVATLIYDKRGTGDSEGDVASATFDDLTADALAGHALLRAHPDIDPQRVGIARFSQGEWIGALAARQTEDVAFVVAYSASGFSPGNQHAWLYGSMLNVRGLGPRPIEAAARFQNTLYSTTDLIDAGYVDPFPHVPGFWFHALDHRLSRPQACGSRSTSPSWASGVVTTARSPPTRAPRSSATPSTAAATPPRRCGSSTTPTTPSTSWAPASTSSACTPTRCDTRPATSPEQPTGSTGSTANLRTASPRWLRPARTPRSVGTTSRPPHPPGKATPPPRRPRCWSCSPRSVWWPAMRSSGRSGADRPHRCNG